jgi:hypothetical protein
MKKTQLLILAICFILIFAGITMIIFSQYKIKASMVIPMTIGVSDRLGFTVETDMLRFGEARPGDVAIRTAEIKNFNDFRVKANFFSHGEIKDWVNIEPIYLNNYEAKNITISAKIPSDAQEGTYNGTLRIIFIKV